MTDLFLDQIDDLPTIDENKNYLEELVGEGKKFSDPTALARGKYEADLFVERLKQENLGLRNELNSRVKMEEFLDKLNTSSQQKSPDAGQQPSDLDKGTPGLKPEDVIQLLDKREQQKAASQNVNRVKERLQETLGPNYANKLKQVAQDLGLSTDNLNSLASTSPDAFFKVVGIETKKEQDLFQAPLRNQMSPTFTPKDTVKDWNYYEDLRKKDKIRYWSTAVQNQMHQDAMRLGDKFKP